MHTVEYAGETSARVIELYIKLWDPWWCVTRASGAACNASFSRLIHVKSANRLNMTRFSFQFFPKINMTSARFLILWWFTTTHRKFCFRLFTFCEHFSTLGFVWITFFQHSEKVCVKAFIKLINQIMTVYKTFLQYYFEFVTSWISEQDDKWH